MVLLDPLDPGSVQLHARRPCGRGTAGAHQHQPRVRVAPAQQSERVDQQPHALARDVRRGGAHDGGLAAARGLGAERGQVDSGMDHLGLTAH